jgi:hypothetical protein
MIADRRMIIMLRKLAFSLVMLLAMAAAQGPRAQSASDADQAIFKQIISDQIAAFNADDSARAYSFAAPTIQALFPSPEIFLSMVKNGYRPVYRQKSFAFGEITEAAGRPVQHVTIVDATGKLWTALYTMQKQPDGSWKISACVLVEMPGADA